VLILGIALLVVVVVGAPALAHQINKPVGGRSSRTGKGRTVGKGRAGTSKGSSGKGGLGGTSKTTTPGGLTPSWRSWFLKAWNASGAPKTSETTLRGAGAVVTGKAAGAASRGGWRASKRLGRGGVWFGNKALIPFDRWLERKRSGLEAAAGIPAQGDTTTHEDVVREPDKARERQDKRTVADFTAEELLFTPRGRLALKEQQLKTMKTAFEKLRADGLIAPEDVAEHKAARKRLESEIEQLRVATGTPTPITRPGPAATPPPVFVNPSRTRKGEPVANTTIGGGIPPTLAPHLNHINDFEPDSDAELLNMMGAEVAGKAAEAEAYQELFERCVSGHGLDPAAMQGLSDYSEVLAETAQAMTNAHKQFVAVYEAIIEAVNNGTQMPHDGRFFSGEANVA
jgi:hypothetical protein